MSNDRELLELAAKAAGLKIDKSETSGRGRGNTGFNCMGDVVLDWHNGTRWNPLTDDGDALRLAVKLFLTVGVDDGVTDVLTDIGRGASEAHDSDAHAATRRAIVRAAAEIGKEMK